jgi:hypothetical protein
MGNNKLLFSICWTLIINFGLYYDIIQCVLLHKGGWMLALNEI